MSDPLGDRDPFDDLLRARLERLSAAIPVEPLPVTGGSPRPRRPAGRRWLRAAMLAVATLLLVSLGAVATVVWIGTPAAATGAFAEGGPLHCSGIDQLAPPDAERWLTAHGLTAHWQVEDREARTSVSQDAPPPRGSITDALALADGHVLILVDLSRDTPLPPKPC